MLARLCLRAAHTATWQASWEPVSVTRPALAHPGAFPALTASFSAVGTVYLGLHCYVLQACGGHGHIWEG